MNSHLIDKLSLSRLMKCAYKLGKWQSREGVKIQRKTIYYTVCVEILFYSPSDIDVNHILNYRTTYIIRKCCNKAIASKIGLFEHMPFDCNIL